MSAFPVMLQSEYFWSSVLATNTPACVLLLRQTNFCHLGRHPSAAQRPSCRVGHADIAADSIWWDTTLRRPPSLCWPPRCCMLLVSTCVFARDGTALGYCR